MADLGLSGSPGEGQGPRLVGCPSGDGGGAMGVPPFIHSVAHEADHVVVRGSRAQSRHRAPGWGHKTGSELA